jgi:ABC-type antimicrobial peptide transport system permease subunit
MSFFDILRLALRNLREAKLRSILTSMGVIVGVAVIVTMVSFGLGLQRNTVSRFKAVDLFNEITVFGQSLTTLATSAQNQQSPGNNSNSNDRRGRASREESRRPLDDQAIKQISAIPGVVAVEPSVSFSTFLKSNGRTHLETMQGVLVPNLATRFREFDAGQMISSPEADEIVVTQNFLKDFGFASPGDAIGKTVEILSPPATHSGGMNFFGIPIPDDEQSGPIESELVTKSFRIAGVLKESNSGGFRGFAIPANVFVTFDTAKSWRSEHPDSLNEIAMRLARESGTLGREESAGYNAAVVRVADPAALTDVRKKLNELGFNSFSIVDQMEQIRNFFLIMNSVLGVLGGISLLVASFGIANTMIMSILERTREIGIMKAIGAEDCEIKLIFFVEAALIGFTGGIIGCLAAWGIDGIANRVVYRFVLRPQGGNYVDFFSLPAYLWLGAILFAVLISIVAALYPAARAARIDPVRALRHD